MEELVGQTVSDENGNQYNILEKINAGVFGVIVKVKTQKNNEIFAMKIYKNSHPSILRSWEIEVRAMKTVMNVAVEKNIVRIVDSGFLNANELPDGLSNHFLVMNMLGPSVYEVMNPKKTHEMYGTKIAFDYPSIKSIAHQVAVAMIELHKSKIIHLDLKPENICFVKINNNISTKRMVDAVTLVNMENTQIQVVDLGCAVFLTDEESPDHFINYEAQTQNYRAPEVFLGLGVSRKSDVWSYGCILSELYTGDLLFFGATDKNAEEEQIDVMTYVLQRSIPYKMYENAFDMGSRKVTMTKKGLHFHKFNMTPVAVSTIFACVRSGDRYGMYLYDLILLILEMDPEDRPSFSEIIKNEYFVDNVVIELDE